MSKSFALCSEGGNLAKHTTERSRGWEGDKEKNISGENAVGGYESFICSYYEYHAAVHW